MTLFLSGSFTLHSGQRTSWKIDCDGLEPGDVETCAALMASMVGPFSVVDGIPTGGTRLALAMDQYLVSCPEPTLLLVDDVLTTGKSMEAFRQKAVHLGFRVKGAVIFSRGDCPGWVQPLFQYLGTRV